MALNAKQKDKARRYIRVTMIFIAILLIFFAVVIPIVNNGIALGVEKDLKKLSHPAKTTVVESTSAAGRMVGKGSSVQYFGAVLIQSELSLGELMAYYSELDCVVERQEKAAIRALDGELSFRHADYEGNYFIVYRWGDAPNWLEDILNTDMR